MNIRDYIKSNFKGCSEDEIESSITSAVFKEEEVLPGLGVFFEMLWNISDDNERRDIIKKLYSELKKAL